jgi:hypothetical protein
MSFKNNQNECMQKINLWVLVGSKAFCKTSSKDVPNSFKESMESYQYMNFVMSCLIAPHFDFRLQQDDLVLHIMDLNVLPKSEIFLPISFD